MTSTSRRLLADFVIYGAGDFLVRLSALIALPVYTRVFSPDDYGLWAYVFTAAMLLGDMLSLGGASAYSRLFFEVSTEQDRRRLTSTWIVSLTVWMTITTAALLPFAGLISRWSFGVDAHRDLVRAALLAVPVRTLNMALGQVVRNQMRPAMFSALNIASAALECGLSMAAVLWLRMGVIGLPLGMAAAGLLMLPFRAWSVRSLLCLEISGLRLREVLSIGVPLVPSTLSFWILSVSDRIMLGKLSTLDQVGRYSVASYLVSAMAMLYGALGQAWSPHMLKIYHEDRAAAPRIMGQMATYVLILFGLTGVAITAFAPELLQLLTTPEYYSAAAAVGPLSLGMAAYASTQVTASGIGLFKRTGLLSLHSWVAALINVGLNLAFIPRFGMMAAAWTTAAAFLYLTTACLVSSQRLWTMEFEKGRVATVIATTVGFTMASLWLPRPSFAAAIAVDAGMVVGYGAILAAFGAVTRREWDRMRSHLLRGRQVPPASYHDRKAA